jgi:cyanate lyase
MGFAAGRNRLRGLVRAMPDDCSNFVARAGLARALLLPGLVAEGDAGVLLLPGEAGTATELFAQSLHLAGARVTPRRGAARPAMQVPYQPLNGEHRMNRNDVSEMIIAAKIQHGIKWSDVARKIGLAKEWVTAGCLGQMTFDKKQAAIIGKIFGLPAEAAALLQSVPYKGSLATAVPTDPLIYRLYELVNVYGSTIKELIHEEFGDGIMSAIDFKMNLKREPNAAGDRVNIVMSGKFLPYKTY